MATVRSKLCARVTLLNLCICGQLKTAADSLIKYLQTGIAMRHSTMQPQQNLRICGHYFTRLYG